MNMVKIVIFVVEEGEDPTILYSQQYVLSTRTRVPAVHCSCCMYIRYENYSLDNVE